MNNTINNKHVEALLSNDMGTDTFLDEDDESLARSSERSCTSPVQQLTPPPSLRIDMPFPKADLPVIDKAADCLPLMESNGVSFEGIPLDDVENDNDHEGLHPPEMAITTRDILAAGSPTCTPLGCYAKATKDDMLNDTPATSCISRLTTDPGDPAQAVPLSPLPLSVEDAPKEVKAAEIVAGLPHPIRPWD